MTVRTLAWLFVLCTSAAGSADAGKGSPRPSARAYYAAFTVDGQRTCLELVFQPAPDAQRPGKLMVTDGEVVVSAQYRTRARELRERINPVGLIGTLELEGVTRAGNLATPSYALYRCQEQTPLELGSHPVVAGRDLWPSYQDCTARLPAAESFPTPDLPPVPAGPTSWAPAQPSCWGSIVQALREARADQHRPRPPLTARQQRLLNFLQGKPTLYASLAQGCQPWRLRPKTYLSGELYRSRKAANQPVEEVWSYSFTHQRDGSLLLELSGHAEISHRADGSEAIRAAGDVVPLNVNLDNPASVGVDEWFHTQQACEASLPKTPAVTPTETSPQPR